MTLIYLLYILIMVGNDGKLTYSEIASLSGCFFILAALAAIYYLVYRYTVKSMCRNLEILQTF